MIETSAEHRRRPAVVLGCTEHHDGVHWPALILLAHYQNGNERDRVDRCCGQEDQADRSTHRSKLWPCFGTWTSPTPSSRRIVAIASRATGSPCTTKARLTGPPRRRTHDLSSSRSA